VLANVRVRPGFGELVELARKRSWGSLILSSGFHELIEPVLAREGVEVEVKANRLDPDPSGWRVLWRDETICASCGEACKRAALPVDGEVVYVGDGVSDRCAALAAKRVFATRGLARYLEERGAPFERFADFYEIVAALG
jgi:2-hydroxy-3-keto-5-methylthiopentenyl-1-phosphate phosphatase